MGLYNVLVGHALSEKAALGAKFLDRVRPEWDEVVNPATVNIASSDYCVLGQIFGSYHIALSFLQLSQTDQERYGFVVSSFSAFLGCHTLNRAWAVEIRRRRNARLVFAPLEELAAV